MFEVTPRTIDTAFSQVRPPLEQDGYIAAPAQSGTPPQPPPRLPDTAERPPGTSPTTVLIFYGSRAARSGFCLRSAGYRRTSGPAATGCMLTSTAARWPSDSPRGTRSLACPPPPDPSHHAAILSQNSPGHPPAPSTLVPRAARSIDPDPEVTVAMSIPESKDVTIVNVCSGKVLQASGPGDGSVVGQSWYCDDRDAAQRWRLIPVHGLEHQYLIANADNSMVLEVLEESHEDGARILLRADRSGAHKRWRLILVSDDEYAIINVNSGKALDVYDASHDDDATIAQFKYWHGPQQRWRLATPDASTTTRAIMTMVRDEHVFLPIWLRYYSKFFQAENIYVLDHHSTDGSTDGDGFVRIPISQPTYGVAWQNETVQRYQHELIDQYDVVLSTDADEIVAPDPRHQNLGEYIDHFDQDFVTCRGYEVLHMKNDEAPYDQSRPILTQRSTWYHNPLYSKSLLARVPMLWNVGFHERMDRRTNSDPHLYLIHLHRIDYDICLARHRVHSNFPQEQEDIDKEWGYQTRITDPLEFANWFYHDSCTSFPIQPQKIPSQWRNLV